MTNETNKKGQPACCAPGDLSNQLVTTTFENTKLNVIPLNWKEVYYTNCPLVSASNVDQELGWTREEYKKIGVKYAFLRSSPRERLVSALHPQSRQPHPLRRLVPARPGSRGHPPDPALGGDARAARRRLHDGARPGRHLPDGRAERQENRPVEKSEH